MSPDVEPDTTPASVACVACGKELRLAQHDMIGNARYNTWCRGGYCSIECYVGHGGKWPVYIPGSVSDFSRSDAAQDSDIRSRLAKPASGALLWTGGLLLTLAILATLVCTLVLLNNPSRQSGGEGLHGFYNSMVDANRIAHIKGWNIAVALSLWVLWFGVFLLLRRRARRG